MSWKPEVLVQGEWSQNALVFATKEEAEACAKDTFRRWTLAHDSRAVESDHPVNYRWIAPQGLISLRSGERLHEKEQG